MKDGELFNFEPDKDENCWSVMEYYGKSFEDFKGKLDYSFNEQEIKEILMTIKEPKENIEVKIKNEKKIRETEFKTTSLLGTYRKNLITLYLPDIKNYNQLIETSIHEYSHHLMPYYIEHETQFWECYFELLKIAEEKGFYSCNINSCEKLKKITAIIKENNLIKSRKIFKGELSGIFYVIGKLCEEINIDLQYYTVKYLEMTWYKNKNPLSSYRRLKDNHISNSRYFRETTIDDFLQKLFIDYSCSGIS